MNNYQRAIVLKNPNKWAISIMFCLLNMVVLAQPSGTIHQAILNHTDSIYERLLSLRKDLHQHPETAGQEKWTSEYVARYLQELGLEVKTGIGGYGVVGVLKGAIPGRKVAWRADIDGLSWNTPETGPIASLNEGRRHACGHDVHTTIALGMANVLASQKEHIKGTIYFIFQPSEEDFQGAKSMLADGLLDKIEPEEIYAAHVSPMPAGLIASKPGYIYADYKQVNLVFQQTKQSDAIIAFSKQLVSDLQNVAADSKFWDTRNLMDPQIGLANPQTIFKDFITVDDVFKVTRKDGSMTISGYVSSSCESLITSVLEKLKEQINNSDYASLLVDVAFGSKQIAFSNERGNIRNDQQLTKGAIQDIAKVYGPGSAIELYGVIPDGRGDDFAYFQERVPGVYFFLGGSNFEKGIIAMPHSPGFAVDESCIKSGVNYFSSLLIGRVSQ